MEYLTRTWFPFHQTFPVFTLPQVIETPSSQLDKNTARHSSPLSFIPHLICWETPLKKYFPKISMHHDLSWHLFGPGSHHLLPPWLLFKISRYSFFSVSKWRVLEWFFVILCHSYPSLPLWLHLHFFLQWQSIGSLGLPCILLVLALKVIHPRQFLSPWRTGTVVHSTKPQSLLAALYYSSSMSEYLLLLAFATFLMFLLLHLYILSS